jgi:hypothetical protein
MLNLRTAPLIHILKSSLHECTQLGPSKGFIYPRQTVCVFFCGLPVLVELLWSYSIIGLYLVVFVGNQLQYIQVLSSD